MKYNLEEHRYVQLNLKMLKEVFKRDIIAYSIMYLICRRANGKIYDKINESYLSSYLMIARNTVRSKLLILFSLNFISNKEDGYIEIFESFKQMEEDCIREDNLYSTYYPKLSYNKNISVFQAVILDTIYLLSNIKNSNKLYATSGGLYMSDKLGTTENYYYRQIVKLKERGFIEKGKPSNYTRLSDSICSIIKYYKECSKKE
jgi:hypothetical protein